MHIKSQGDSWSPVYNFLCCVLFQTCYFPPGPKMSFEGVTCMSLWFKGILALENTWLASTVRLYKRNCCERKPAVIDQRKKLCPRGYTILYWLLPLSFTKFLTRWIPDVGQSIYSTIQFCLMASKKIIFFPHPKTSLFVSYKIFNSRYNLNKDWHLLA